MIRNKDQVPNVEALAGKQPGKLNVLVRSVEEVKSEEQAKAIIDEVKPDYVVWSAGTSSPWKIMSPGSCN
jgi:hypothetical protein